MQVLGISGSLRRDSHNTRLLRAAGEIAREQGAEFEMFDGLKAIPPYDEDDDIGGGPMSVARLRQASRAARCRSARRSRRAPDAPRETSCRRNARRRARSR